MFEQFKNIDSAFKLSRIVTIITITGSVIFCSYNTYTTKQIIREKDKKLLVIANGKIFEAFADDRGKYWGIEVRDHVKTFHFYFFTLQPDDIIIKQHINKALYLADNSAASEYNNLRESGYYSSLIAANVTQEIESENIEIDLNTTPWKFRYTGKLRIIRATNIVTRSLITEGIIRITQPSDNNPHGLMIERWRVIENKDLTTSNR